MIQEIDEFCDNNQDLLMRNETDMDNENATET